MVIITYICIIPGYDFDIGVYYNSGISLLLEREVYIENRITSEDIRINIQVAT